MELNADFSKSVIVRPEDNEWVASPMPGVDRMMLDRIGEEVARATSIVRYAPGSQFSAHTHDGGEEFLVLDGVFSDEHGDFPTGAYIRNPPTSAHTPGSGPGCVIFVKLWQMQPDDRTHVRIATDKLGAVEMPSGGAVSPLYKDTFEDVRIVSYGPGEAVEIVADGGAEALILSGTLSFDGGSIQPWTWIRRANGEDLVAEAGLDGARLWVKSGHMQKAQAPAAHGS